MSDDQSYFAEGQKGTKNLASTHHGQMLNLTGGDAAVSRSILSSKHTIGSGHTSVLPSHHRYAAAEEHKGPEYLALNPRGQIPTLVGGDIVVCESLAALLYLEETYPEHPLLPSGRKERALVSPSNAAGHPHCRDPHCFAVTKGCQVSQEQRAGHMLTLSIRSCPAAGRTAPL